MVACSALGLLGALCVVWTLGAWLPLCGSSRMINICLGTMRRLWLATACLHVCISSLLDPCMTPVHCSRTMTYNGTLDRMTCCICFGIPCCCMELAGAPNTAVWGHSVSPYAQLLATTQSNHFFPVTKVACICSVGCFATLDCHLGS